MLQRVMSTSERLYPSNFSGLLLAGLPNAAVCCRYTELCVLPCLFNHPLKIATDALCGTNAEQTSHEGAGTVRKAVCSAGYRLDAARDNHVEPSS